MEIVSGKGFQPKDSQFNSVHQTIQSVAKISIRDEKGESKIGGDHWEYCQHSTGISNQTRKAFGDCHRDPGDESRYSELGNPDPGEYGPV